MEPIVAARARGFRRHRLHPLGSRQAPCRGGGIVAVLVPDSVDNVLEPKAENEPVGDAVLLLVLPVLAKEQESQVLMTKQRA